MFVSCQSVIRIGKKGGQFPFEFELLLMTIHVIYAQIIYTMYALFIIWKTWWLAGFKILIVFGLSEEHSLQFRWENQEIEHVKIYWTINSTFNIEHPLTKKFIIFVVHSSITDAHLNATKLLL